MTEPTPPDNSPPGLAIMIAIVLIALVAFFMPDRLDETIDLLDKAGIPVAEDLENLDAASADEPVPDPATETDTDPA